MELNPPTPSSQDRISETSHPPPPQSSEEDLYRHIASYPFHTDHDYLLGLGAILGHPDTAPTESELASNTDLVLQAQCFYLARKFGLTQINVGEYKTWLAENPRPNADGKSSTSYTQAAQEALPAPHSAPTLATGSPASTHAVQPNQPLPTTSSPPTSQSQPTDSSPPYPPTFAEIVDLITQNKPVPGIETIPDTVLELGSSKADHAPRRKKPWEQDTPTEQADAQGGHEAAVDVENRTRTGEGVMKILQPGAVPDSGLVARE